MKKNAKASWAIRGSAENSSAGASNRASAGEVSRIWAATSANSVMNATILITRASRNRVQSENRLRNARSVPPNTRSDQKRWYADHRSLMKKCTCRSSSAPASHSNHCDSTTWMRTASANGSSGLSAIDAHTTISQANVNSSSSRNRSHSDIRLRVGPGSACGGSSGGVSPSCAGAGSTGAVMTSPGW